jgi:signal transduction histidine kinase
MSTTANPAREPADRTETDRLLLHAVHDLKTPLRQSLLRAQLLERSAASLLNPESEAHIAAIVDANRAANMLLTRVAEFCLAGSNQNLAPPMPPAILLKAALQSLSPAAAELKLEMVNMPAQAVPASLQKAFFELLDNAWKFRRHTPNQTEVRITSSTPPSKIVFEIRDNGIGFDPRYVDLVWEPFQKLGSASAFPGAGLGLAIVRRIIQTLGGETWASSVPGEGSTFALAIPDRR